MSDYHTDCRVAIVTLTLKLKTVKIVTRNSKLNIDELEKDNGIKGHLTLELNIDILH